MKKSSVFVSALMVIVILAFSGCASNKLADIYSEEEVVAKANDLTAIDKMISKLEPKYLPYAEDLLRTFILAINK